MKLAESLAVVYKRDPDEFLDKVTPQIEQAMSKYHFSGVDKSVLRSKAESLAMKAAKTYKPESGASFQTHLYNGLKGLYRTVNQMQGITRISENKKREYNSKKDDPIFNREQSYQSGLNDMLGNTEDLSRHKLDLSEVMHITDFTGSEKELLKHMGGLEGKQKLDKDTEIAKAMNVSTARVSTLKKQVSNKIAPYVVKHLNFRTFIED